MSMCVCVLGGGGVILEIGVCVCVCVVYAISHPWCLVHSRAHCRAVKPMKCAAQRSYSLRDHSHFFVADEHEFNANAASHCAGTQISDTFPRC
jgi:hypothetical protein